MSDDVKEWLGQCTVCIKRKSPAGRHHPLGNIPTGQRWDRIDMDILDVCHPTLEDIDTSWGLRTTLVDGGLPGQE